MTVINPNSISGVASVTAQGDIIQFYKSDGTLGAVQFDGANFNTTSGVSTFNNLYVGGVLTYEDVKNVDSVGIVTARAGIRVTGGNVGINSTIPSQKLDVMDGTIVVHPASKTGVALNGIAGQDVGVIRWGGDNHHAIILRGSSSADGSTITGGNTMEFREYGAYSFKTGNNSGTMAERLRINSAGLVGIGTIDPSLALLHIGPASYSLNLQNNASNESKILFTKNTNAGDARAWIKGNGELTGHLKFGAGDADRVTINSSGQLIAGSTLTGTEGGGAKLCIVGTGAVGANPSSIAASTLATFRMTGATGHAAGISILAGNGGSSALNFGDSDNELIGRILYNHTSGNATDYMAFYVQGSEKLHITSGGVLGVRTTPESWHTDRRAIQIGGAALSGQNPADGQELALTNNAYYDTSNNRWEFIANDDASGITMSNGGIQFLRSPSSGTADAALSWSTSVFINDIGYLKTNSELWVGGSSPVLRWRNASSEFATARIDSTHLYFEVANQERLRIKSGGTVAIPAQGSSNANPRLLFESAVDANDFSFSQYEDGNGTYTLMGQNLQLSSGGNTTILDSGHRTAGIMFDGRNNGALMFYTGNTNAQDEALRITSGGNIGIGEHNPGRKVHIKNSGIIKLENTSTGGWLGLEFLASSGTNNYDGYMGLLDSNGLFFIDNNSNGIDFAITQTGLIQISEPGISAGNGGSAKFQVKSTGQYDGIALGNVSSYGTIGSNGNGALVFTGNAYPANLGGGSPITYEWWSGSGGGGGPNKLMTMASNGRVNIGEGNSGTALAALHINTPSVVGTDTALFIGHNADNRFMTINQNPSSEQFSHMSLRYNDNARRAVLQLENPYAASTGFGTQILFQGYNEGTQAYIETANTATNSAQSTLRLHSSGNSGIDITHDSGVYIRQATGYRGILVQGHSSASHSSAVVTGNSTSSHTNIELAYAGTKGQLNFGGHGDGSVYLQVESGYVVGTSTLQFDYSWHPGGNGGIRATMWASHWTAGYDLYWEGFIFGDSYSGITLREHFARTSSTQGAWSITRPANNKLRISKSAGSYGGGMYYVIMMWHPGRSMTLTKD